MERVGCLLSWDAWIGQLEGWTCVLASQKQNISKEYFGRMQKSTRKRWIEKWLQLWLLWRRSYLSNQPIPTFSQIISYIANTIIQIGQKMSKRSSHRESTSPAWNPHRIKREEWFQEDIAMAKVNKKLKKELRRQMEIIREGKAKRKHRHRSKKRSSSSDATFSTDSDREQSRKQPKQANNPKRDELKLSTEQLYDLVMNTPEQPTIPSLTSYHPNGSILFLTSSKVQITTRSSRLNLQAQILTQQSHKTIIQQLVDPGMSLLLINKDKNQTQIIDHLLHTQKKYRFLVCWFQPKTQEGKGQLEKVIEQVNSQGRILGWQNDDVKMHFLTLRQLRKIERLSIPSGLLGTGEKLAMIVQYPQTLLNVRHKYQPFSAVSIKEPLNSQIQAKPDYSSINIVYEGWDSPQKSDSPQTTEQVPTLPKHIQQIKDHFGIKEFQPILSDEEDHKKPVKDLATELLDSIKAAPLPAELFPRQFHNSYYNKMYEVGNNWQVPMQVYNPFNPITGKFTFALKYNPAPNFNKQKNNSQKQGHEHLNASYSISQSYRLGYQQ